MRIMYVVNSFGAGGAERHLLVLAKHMVSAGHRVLVVALTARVPGGAKSLVEDFISAGVETLTLDSAWYVRLGDFWRLYLLRRTANAWNPDIVHSHLPRADFAASFVKRMLPDTVWICTIHDAYIKGVYVGYWVFRWVGWNWNLADHIVAVSGHARRWVMDELKISDSKISVIYHGATRPAVGQKPRKIREARDGGPLLIGCLSRYEQRKGIATLIKAMAIVLKRHPTARLLVAGSDPNGYAQKMRKLADSLQVSDAVDLRAFCDTPYDFLDQLDVFAFASFSEGFGIVLLEAMASGLPVVASNIYPLNHIVSDGVTGLLANPEDVQSFSSAICDLLENPKLALCMGEAGKIRCTEQFSERTMIASIQSLYEGLSGLPFLGGVVQKM